MALSFDIPGSEPLRLDYLVLDVNGTVTECGILIEGVEERIGHLREAVEVRLLSADTLGTLDGVAERLGVQADRISRGEEKRAYVDRLGAERCAAIGNGANDAAMLEVARLGIVIVGPEGAGGATVRTADVLCRSILDALDLLLAEDVLASTLRP
jgi:P-type E1-E2 ATPase